MRQLTALSKWLTISGIIIVMPAVSAFGVNAAATMKKATIKKVTVKKAADVNGVVISMNTLDDEYSQVLKEKGITETDVPAAQAVKIKKQLLTSLINQELLYQESVKDNIVVKDADVQKALAKVKSRYQNDAAYQAALRGANLQEKEFVGRIKRTLAINELVKQKIGSKVVVTDAETKQYYDSHPDTFKQPEKVRARHILIRVKKDATAAEKAAAKAKIVEIQKKLKAGADFADLAKKYSDGPSSVNGGDLGYFERGQMVKPFEDAAFALKPGEVSGIVKTQFGYHLIKVVDKKPAETLSYDTVKESIANYLKREKLSAGVTSLLETLRQNSKIETYL